MRMRHPNTELGEEHSRKREEQVQKPRDGATLIWRAAGLGRELSDVHLQSIISVPHRGALLGGHLGSVLRAVGSGGDFK